MTRLYNAPILCGVNMKKVGLATNTMINGYSKMLDMHDKKSDKWSMFCLEKFFI